MPTNDTSKKELEKEIRGLLDDHYKYSKESSIEKIIELLKPYIYKLAQGFNAPCVDIDDLVQEGRIGLLSAIRKYDPSKGASFLNYSNTWIKSGMRRTVYKNLTSITIPESQVQIALKIKKILDNNPDINPKQIAEMVNKSLDNVKKLIRAIPLLEHTSLDDFVKDHNGDLQSHKELSFEPYVEIDLYSQEKEQLQLMERQINIAIKKGLIKERNFEILKLIIGYESEPFTLKEVGEMYKITEQRVFEIKRSTILALESLLKDYSSLLY